MAKPKLALVPAAQGSKFYSVLPSSGVGDFNFTRSGSATRINSQGLIETVANGVSRLNYPMIDGVVKGCPHHILEPQRLQKIRYSEDFSQAWNLVAATITSNATISPDGTLNADELVENLSNSAHRLYTPNISVDSGSSYTFSIFAKYKNRKYLQLTFNASQFSSTQFATFDLINGVVSGSSSGVANIEKYKNDWYRLTFTATATVSSTNSSVFIITSNVPNLRDPSYQGNGSSVYLFGAQLEEGSYPTSYIPNYGTALGVTRSAETATGSGDAATFNDSEGVLMAEISALVSDSTAKAITINQSSTNELGFYYYQSRIDAYVISGTNQFSTTFFLNPNTSNKISLKYKVNDFALWVNGFEVATDNSGTTPSGLNKLEFTDSFSNNFYGNTKQVQYYDTALTNSELETLTSWVSFQDMAEGQLYTIE